MSLLSFGPSLFVQGALVFYVLGLLMRDGLRLRLFLLAGTGCYLAYYATVAAQPLWDAMLSSAAIGAANLYAILRLMLERTTLGMSGEDRALYGHFATLTPGQFRSLLRAGTREKVSGDTVLTRAGEVPEALWFVIRGPVTLGRDSRETGLPAQGFIGERSFILGDGAPASATVVLGPGGSAIRWDRARLARLLDRSQPLANAVAALFNRDLADKLGRSWPG